MAVEGKTEVLGQRPKYNLDIHHKFHVDLAGFEHGLPAGQDDDKQPRTRKLSE